MSLSESTVQNQIRDASAQLGDYAWRNNSGVLRDDTGRPVRFGLGNDNPKINKVVKSSDLIGLTSLVITPDMVGQTVAVFTAVEVKEEGWTFNPRDARAVAQKAFIDIVLRAGGFAGFAQSVDDYRSIVKK